MLPLLPYERIRLRRIFRIPWVKCESKEILKCLAISEVRFSSYYVCLRFCAPTSFKHVCKCGMDIREGDHGVLWLMERIFSHVCTVFFLTRTHAHNHTHTHSQRHAHTNTSNHTHIHKHIHALTHLYHLCRRGNHIKNINRRRYRLKR